MVFVGHDGNILVILVAAWMIGHLFLRTFVRGALIGVKIVFGLIILIIAIYVLNGKAFDGKITPGIITQGPSP